MNKSDLVDAIAKSAEISKAAAARALDLPSIHHQGAEKGDSVSLVGFGTKVGKRAARNGRNPRTGETIKIKQPRFQNLQLAKV